MQDVDAFLRGLVARGLSGVRLVISDAHPGLIDAIAGTMATRDPSRDAITALGNTVDAEG